MRKTKIGFIHEVAKFISDITGLPSNEISRNYLAEIEGPGHHMYFFYQGDKVRMGITNHGGHYFAEIN
jgi:uncharacterized lipoprotein YehR (DUF1307 family)